MATVSSGGVKPQCPGRRRGFSLIELITALAVVGVAATLMMSLFQQSLGLGHSARNRIIAARLAEAQLGALIQHPERFVWPASPSGEDRFSITTSDSDKHGYTAAGQPSVVPSDPRSRNRETVLYDRFKWQAYGRFPAPDSPYCELSVEVIWEESGKGRAFVLTSALPRSLAEIPRSQAAQPKAEASQ